MSNEPVGSVFLLFSIWFFSNDLHFEMLDAQNTILLSNSIFDTLASIRVAVDNWKRTEES